MTELVVALALLLLAGIVYLVVAVKKYNRLKALLLQVFHCQGVVACSLQRRHDLVPNAADVAVRSAHLQMRHLFRLIRGKRRLMRDLMPPELAEQPDLSEEDTKALCRFMAGAAAVKLPAVIPGVDMSAFPNLQNLMGECEKDILAARNMTQSAIVEYNTAVSSIPDRFFAARFGLRPVSFFRVPEEYEKPPELWARPRVRERR